MRIALLTANIGDIDEIRPPVKQNTTHEVEVLYYTENTLPFPLPNIDNRLKGKYLKTQHHRFLDHDVFIWIDGSIEVISPDFIDTCVTELIDSNIVSSKHNQRKNVYEELEYVINNMKSGDQYLLRRYAKQPFYQEHSFYKQSGLPKDYQLFNCFFFARLNEKEINAMFDTWWDTIMRYSNFDQTAFSFAAWQNKVIIKDIGTDNLFIRHKHQ